MAEIVINWNFPTRGTIAFTRGTIAFARRGTITFARETQHETIYMQILIAHNFIAYNIAVLLPPIYLYLSLD